MSQNIALGSLPFKDVFGLALAWGSATTLTVGAGQARDTNNVMDMVLSETITLNAATVGVNGLDTGALANSTWYYVYLIGSSQNYKATGLLLSASSTPQMPQDYDSRRRIGMVLTSGAAAILSFDVYGNSSTRKYFWDAVATELNAQGSATFADVDLASSVPPTSTVVYLNWKLVPATAGNISNLRKNGSASTTNIQLTGSVTSQPNAGQVIMNTDSAQVIEYITASASDDLTLIVTGFEDYI